MERCFVPQVVFDEILTATQISQVQKKVTRLQSEWVDATFPEEPIISILHEYEKSILRKKERDNNANFPTCSPTVVANELSVGEGSQNCKIARTNV